MIVLDASALVDVVADRAPRDAVLDRIEGERVLAPGHQLAEVSSAVVRLLRAGELDNASAERALDDAAALVQEVVPITRDHLRRAFALRDNIRILDGIYVSLAESRDCPLVTTDGRLARSNPPCQVVMVGSSDTSAGSADG